MPIPTVPSILVVQGYGDACRIRRSLYGERGGADGGARRLGRRLWFSRVAEGMLREVMQVAEDRFLEVYAGEGCRVRR